MKLVLSTALWSRAGLMLHSALYPGETLGSLLNLLETSLTLSVNGVGALENCMQALMQALNETLLLSALTIEQRFKRC